MNKINLLESLEIFQELSESQLLAIEHICTEKNFNKGDKLFTEGDDATHVWAVTQGRVDLRFELPGGRPTSNDQTVSSIKADAPLAQILGWSCFVPPYKMRLSGYCVSRDCKIIQIEKNQLIKCFQHDPLLGYIIMTYLIKVVGYRFHQFQDIVAKTMGETLMSGW